MKILAITITFLTIGFNPCSAQNTIKDWAFVRIDKLEKGKISYGVSQGKLIVVTILVKNKYENQLGFASGYFNSDLVLKERAKIDPKKVVGYNAYNEMLNNDFYDVYFHFKTYFVISEDKYHYLVLGVKVTLPPELNKM